MEDHCKAIDLIIRKGRVGEVYNVGGHNEMRNIDIVKLIIKELGNWDDGDEIISTPMTFISTNHAVIKSNLKTVFADIDESLCLDPKSVEEHITDKTRAVMFVGFGGNTGKLKKIAKICKDHGLKLILDAAHMSGTRYRNGDVPGTNGEADIQKCRAGSSAPASPAQAIPETAI